MTKLRSWKARDSIHQSKYAVGDEGALSVLALRRYLISKDERPYLFRTSWRIPIPWHKCKLNRLFHLLRIGWMWMDLSVIRRALNDFSLGRKKQTAYLAK